MLTKDCDSKKNTNTTKLTGFGRKKKLYISGPITNHPDFLAEFEVVENRLRSMGFQPINPAKILNILSSTLDYNQMMYLCFILIELSDGIYMMRGWKESQGARLELEHAFQCDKASFFEEYDE